MDNNMFSKIDRNKLNSALSSAAQSNGIDAERLEGALNSGKIDSVLSALNPGQAKGLKNLLSDKEALNRILSSPQAAKILKELTK